MDTIINPTPRVYCDNAATTKVAPEVLEALLPYLTGTYGNLSSSHYFGRQAKEAVENARKRVAYWRREYGSPLFGFL